MMIKTPQAYRLYPTQYTYSNSVRCIQQTMILCIFSVPQLHTYLPTYQLEDIYVFNVVTYSVITSALAFSYLVTCNNLCKKFYQNDNVTCQFYQNTWIILVEIYTFVELFVNRMPFFIILSHFEITFSKLSSPYLHVQRFLGDIQ